MPHGKWMGENHRLLANSNVWHSLIYTLSFRIIEYTIFFKSPTEQLASLSKKIVA
jgi:hypothetical protein